MRTPGTTPPCAPPHRVPHCCSPPLPPPLIGTPRPPRQRWHPWTAWPPGTPRPSRTSRPRRSEYGGVPIRTPHCRGPPFPPPQPLSPFSPSAPQNFAPQMSYGYDEKSAGVAVPGPMVSGGVQVGYGVWGREVGAVGTSVGL